MNQWKSTTTATSSEDQRNRSHLREINFASYSQLGRAAGADGITAELLKGAEEPISEALHKVIVTFMSEVKSEY